MYLGVQAWLLVCLWVCSVCGYVKPTIYSRKVLCGGCLIGRYYVPQDFSFLDFSLCLSCVSIIFELATFNCMNNGFLYLVGLWYLFVVCGTCVCFNKPRVSPWFVYIYIRVSKCILASCIWELVIMTNFD